MADYDIFAPFYDSLMGDRDDVIRLLQRVIDRHHPQAADVLELGCGTGTILAGLEGKFSLSGIDLSPEMLKIAQRKLPSASLTVGDIAAFDLPGRYDAIFCVFDTINHLADFSDWEKCFRAAAKHLRSNGLFIFDMDTVSRLQALGNGGGYTQELAGSTADLHITALSPSAVEWDIVIQQTQSDGAIQVYEDHVRETSFPLDQVEASLRQYFDVLETFDSDLAAPSERSDRVYFVCRPSAKSD